MSSVRIISRELLASSPLTIRNEVCQSMRIDVTSHIKIKYRGVESLDSPLMHMQVVPPILLFNAAGQGISLAAGLCPPGV
jgi:hypothetical protein